MAAEVLYATSALLFFSLEDLALQRALFRAYNDWLADFCSHNPKRLIGLALISLEDIEEAVWELERCVKKGLKGAMISVSPEAEKQYDNPVYDPFWAAAQDYAIPLSLHLATGKQNIVTTRNSYAMYMGILEAIQQTLVTIFFSGMLERFPGHQVQPAAEEAPPQIPGLPTEPEPGSLHHPEAARPPADARRYSAPRRTAATSGRRR